MGKLYAGAAKVKASPSQEILDELKAVGAYTQYEKVYKDVYARCVAFTDGEQKFFIFTSENGMFPAQRRFREKMQKEFGVHPDAVMLGNTHNHQGFVASDPDESPGGARRHVEGRQAEINEEIIQTQHEYALQAAREALANAVPARMGYTSGESYINASRDWPTPVGGLQNSDYGGYSDRELVVLKVETEDGQPIASVVNFGVHSNMMYPHRFNGTFNYVCGDLGGEIMEFVENAHAGKETCLWVEAAAGDQNPLVTGFQQGVRALPDGTFEEIHTEISAEATYTLMEHLAQVQGLEILKTEKQIRTYSTEFDLKYGRSVKRIPGKVNAREKFALIFSGEQKGQQGRHQITVDEFKAMEIEPADDVEFKLHLAVLNGIAFAGINTEPYSYLGRIIKDVLPYPKAMVFAIDAGHVGYIPDVRKSEYAGFGTLDSKAQSPWDTERVFYEGFRDLAEEIEKE